MLTPIQKTILYDTNAIYYGYPMEKLMERAGEGIARILVRKYGKGKRIAFVCGPGNNGGDGFVAARHLQDVCKPVVYLVPDAKKIRTLESRLNWKWLKGEKYDNVRAKDINGPFDVIVECLFSTGIKPPVREPYKSVIKKLNSLRAQKVTIDLPAPEFKPHFCISLMFRKMPGAAVVDIDFPESIKEKIGVGEVKVLTQPKAGSHKGDNGKLLIIGGSEQYHGAPLLAAKTAAKIVDLVYFSSTAENNLLAKKLKARLLEFINVPRDEVNKTIKKVDAVLIGPGMGESKENKKFVTQFLKRYKSMKTVLDADALKMLKPKQLHKNCIVTPHKREFRKLFGIAGDKENTAKMARKYSCVIALKGRIDYVASPQEAKVNSSGNVGMTKGGTGDVLAGLIAALACTNDLFLAASASVFINGLAGDRLKQRMSRYYSASDLVMEIPRTIKWCEDY